MARTILTSHVRERGYGKEVLFSLSGHALLLAIFLFAAELFPVPETLLIGSGLGGGQGGDFVTVGLTAELGGGAGLYKPALTPVPEAPPPPARQAQEPEPAPDEEKVFVEEARSKVKEPAQKPAASRPAPAAPPVPSSQVGLIPGKPQPGAGGPGAAGSGAGGGFGGGQGVAIGRGSGEGIIDSWYARQVEQRIGSNWLKTSLGQLGRPVETVVSFEIRDNGQIETIRIEERSGIPSVDLAAERAVRASHPLPPLPYELRGRRVRFVAYFKYPPQ